MMKNKWIITVGREFCTGGADTAKKLADQLGFTYLDKILIDETAEMLEVSSQLVEEKNEKPEGNFDIPTHWYMDEDEPTICLSDAAKIVDTQTRIIQKYAKEGNCVIVGRCADYILRDYVYLLRVFFHSDMDQRIALAVERYDMPAGRAERIIRKTDKQRATYYNRNTKKRQWGSPNSYDLYLNLGTLGEEAAIKAILAEIERRDY